MYLSYFFFQNKCFGLKYTSKTANSLSLSIFQIKSDKSCKLRSLILHIDTEYPQLSPLFLKKTKY